MFVQQHKHLRRCGRADVLASLLMWCACFGAGNHPYKPCRSGMDAAAYACVAAVRDTCRQVLHGSATCAKPRCQHPPLQREKQTKNKPEHLFYEPHASRALHNNISVWYCRAPCAPLTWPPEWVIMNCTHKLNPLDISKHAFLFLLGGPSSVLSYYYFIFRKIFVILRAEI